MQGVSISGERSGQDRRPVSRCRASASAARSPARSVSFRPNSSVCRSTRFSGSGGPQCVAVHLGSAVGCSSPSQPMAPIRFVPGACRHSAAVDCRYLRVVHLFVSGTERLLGLPGLTSAASVSSIRRRRYRQRLTTRRCCKTLPPPAAAAAPRPCRCSPVTAVITFGGLCQSGHAVIDNDGRFDPAMISSPL